MIKKILLIVVVSLFSNNIFAYEILGSVGISQSQHKSQKDVGVALDVEGYVPLWFNGLSVGVGVSYLEGKLGSAKDLSSRYETQQELGNKNINMSLFPMYLTTKYEYFFNQDLSSFVKARIGSTIGNKNYYSVCTISTGEVCNVNNIKDEALVREKLDVFGNTSFGFSAGMSIYKNYMISLSYDNISVKNIYQRTSYPSIDRSNKTHIQLISLKLSYVFRG